MSRRRGTEEAGTQMSFSARKTRSPNRTLFLALLHCFFQKNIKPRNSPKLSDLIRALQIHSPILLAQGLWVEVRDIKPKSSFLWDTIKVNKHMAQIWFQKSLKTPVQNTLYISRHTQGRSPASALWASPKSPSWCPVTRLMGGSLGRSLVL